jgi:hypothetical protein
MSMPPPPPPFGSDPSRPPGSFGGYPPSPPPSAPPPGYAAYGQGGYGSAFQPQKNAGMAVASLVLSLVGLIPCFWVFQVPGLLGLIFGIVGRSQIAKSNGAKKGAGLALAGIIIGAILLVFVVVALLWVRSNCVRDGSRFTCNGNN